MALCLNLEVIAEEVAGCDQLRFHGTLNCDEVQRFHQKMPVAAEDFEAIMGYTEKREEGPLNA